jgi:4-alpha-glucanotransferase
MGAARSIQATPFDPETRSAGVLVHLTSLPSPYGIGDLGRTARHWVDLLERAGQSWWQLLPLSPTGQGNSPYMSISTFAISELLLAPDGLLDEGLLDPTDELNVPHFSIGRVDFDQVRSWKTAIIELAWRRFRGGRRSDLHADYSRFCRSHAHWLPDYALFVALRKAHPSDHYLHWPTEISLRDPVALEDAAKRLHETIDQVSFTQFLLFRQADALKAYANARGVRLLGDLPFFISPDSADVWANPELFLLDADHRPSYVGGVPPDYFSADGQLWGNPVYDWPAHQRTGYRWWIERLRSLLAQVDVIRVDHFRALAAAWHVPAGSATARTGEWRPGPGADLLEAVRTQLGGLPLLAEDLGCITADVVQLREQFQMPGMRVLQFAFDGEPHNPFLPSNYEPNTVVYTGTHDNDTTRGWFRSLDDRTRQLLCRCLGCETVSEEQVTWELIRVAWESVASVAIAPLQDILNLGPEARMNVPGKPDFNWEWRCPPNAFDDEGLERLKAWTIRTGRASTS